MKTSRKVIISIGFVVGIIAIIANFLGKGIDDNTAKFVIVMIFAYQLITTPEEI